jgi:hypothetical protein
MSAPSAPPGGEELLRTAIELVVAGVRETRGG